MLVLLSLTRNLLLAAAVVGFVGVSVPARAELVFFASGRSVSVKGHRIDGDSLIMALRGGGEVVCERSVIVRIEPDEVPYPEPEAGPADPAETNGLKPDEIGTAVPYGEIIDRLAAQHGVDARLVKALIRVESNYQERAKSRKGAMGLMQLMPETVRQYAVSDPYDARANIDAGIKHLKSLLERFPTRLLALAAYNAGEAAVQRFGGVPPYAETRLYVSRILNMVGR